METRADAFRRAARRVWHVEEIMEILTLRQLDVVRNPRVSSSRRVLRRPAALFDRMLREKFFKPSNSELFRVALTCRKFSGGSRRPAREGGVEMVRDP